MTRFLHFHFSPAGGADFDPGSHAARSSAEPEELGAPNSGTWGRCAKTRAKVAETRVLGP